MLGVDAPEPDRDLAPPPLTLPFIPELGVGISSGVEESADWRTVLTDKSKGDSRLTLVPPIFLLTALTTLFATEPDPPPPTAL